MKGDVDRNQARSHWRRGSTFGRQLALLMRFSILLIFLFWVAARANPVAPDPPLNAFISSEKLAVTIGPAEARFNGTFTFKVANDDSNIEHSVYVTKLQIPIWFPADPRQSPAVASFWNAVDKNDDMYAVYLIDPACKKAIEQAVDLKVVLGTLTVPPTELVISGRGGYGYTRIPKSWRQPGYHVLLFTFMVSTRVIDGETPITISYRQPLLGRAGRSSFFYLPIFEHLPKSVSLSDTNHYSITLTAAPNCDLAVTNGLFKTRLGADRDVVLSPRHLQAIHATVQSPANKSVQTMRDGRSSSASQST